MQVTKGRDDISMLFSVYLNTAAVPDVNIYTV